MQTGSTSCANGIPRTTDVLKYLEDVGLTLGELLAMAGRPNTETEHQALKGELVLLCAKGKAELCTVSRLDDRGYTKVMPAFKKKVTVAK